jgi:hypothetical protein
MQIARNSLDTQAGPSDWFTGAVYIDTVAAPSRCTGRFSSVTRRRERGCRLRVACPARGRLRA